MLEDDDVVTSAPAEMFNVDPLATSILGKDNPVFDNVAVPVATYKGLVLVHDGAVVDVELLEESQLNQFVPSKI